MTKVFTSSPRKRGARNGRLDSRFRGNDAWKKRLIVVGVMVAALALAGCGKKGPPGPPPGVPNTYPQNYPSQ
jgi:predicted small lipoprotein YifL